MARVASIAFTRYDSDPRVRRMAESLAASGHEVTVIALGEDGGSQDRQVDGVRVLGLAISQYRGTSLFRYLWQYVLFVVLAAWRLAGMHLRRRFDVVHANNLPDFVVFAALPAKLLGARVILDIHDPMPELFVSKMGEAGFVVRVIEWVERISIRFADLVISVHEVQLETLLGRGQNPAKFAVIQNVPDERRFPRGAARPRPAGDDPVIVYHGLIAPRLGLDVAVRAMELVRKVVPGARLVLIGDGDGSGEVLRLIGELGLEDAVEFEPGFIPVDQLLPRLVVADIGVVPARIDPFTANMLPTKLLEYVTLGIPAVCSDLPAVRRYFRPDQVLMVRPDDPEELARALIELCQDPEGRLEQAKRAMDFLDEINWETESTRYRRLVEELSARR